MIIQPSSYQHSNYTELDTRISTRYRLGKSCWNWRCHHRVYGTAPPQLALLTRLRNALQLEKLLVILLVHSRQRLFNLRKYTHRHFLVNLHLLLLRHLTHISVDLVLSPQPKPHHQLQTLPECRKLKILFLTDCEIFNFYFQHLG